ncbi:MAG: hypothetical protein K0R40_1246, partial [Burkholderiales bacterium]|nr:hypothetical protein [Burkholderiales bacterium]
MRVLVVVALVLLATGCGDSR